MRQCYELPYRFYSPLLQGLLNQVKSTHHTTDHFGSVKYAELVELMAENEIANSLVHFAAVLHQKFIFLNRGTTCRSYYSKKITV